MRSKSIALALMTGAFSCFEAPRALACGGGVVSATTAQVGADAQRIVLSVRSDRTDVVTQITVPETTDDYGVLLPVPAEPVLDPEPVDVSDLDALDEATAPEIFVEDDDGGGGCGCPIAGSDDAKAGGDGSGAVRVSDPVAIGPVTAVVLTADDGDAVNAWLTDNGFGLSADDQAIVTDYSGAGRYFIAIRRDDESAPGSPTSIGVHFSLPGDQRSLPLRFARIGARETVAFTIFVAASEGAAPSMPFEPITLADLDASTLRTADYRTALAHAVEERDGRAFIVEALALKATLPDMGPRLDRLFDAAQTVTRLSTVLSASALTEDATLDERLTGEVPTTRFVQTSNRSGGLPVGASMALACAVIGRRRGRRVLLDR